MPVGITRIAATIEPDGSGFFVMARFMLDKPGHDSLGESQTRPVSVRLSQILNHCKYEPAGVAAGGDTVIEGERQWQDLGERDRAGA